MDDRSLNPLLVSLSEAARLLGLSRSKLYAIINAGEINLVKLGGRSLISVEELRTFVAAKMANASSVSTKKIGGAA